MNRALKTHNARSPKVWHIFRFRERFELADDQRFCRKGPLLYARDFVSGTDDESVGYLQQLDALSRRPDGLALEGAWSRIRRAASRRSRAYRGYLLNERDQPASEAEIARTVLHCTARRAATILQALESVGFIERVRVPDWDLTLNEMPGKKAPAKRRKTRPRKSISREASGKLVGARDPLHAKNKKNGLTGNTEPERQTGFRNPQSGNGEHRTQSQGQGPVNTEPGPPTAPATRSPDGNPQNPAVGGDSSPSKGPSPHCGSNADPRRIANILKFVHWQDAEAVDFAHRVFAILWPEKADLPKDNWANGEIGAFAKWLWKQGPPGQRQNAIDKGIEAASHVAKNRKSYKRPGGACMYIASRKTGSDSRRAKVNA
jgi:hypothetical protein